MNYGKQILAASLIVIFLAGIVPLASSAAKTSSYTVYVWSNDGYSFSGKQTINIEGHILPSPGPGTQATVILDNPAGSLVSIGVAKVAGSTGLFTISFVTGGHLYRESGTYTVYVIWSNNLQTSWNTLMTFSYHTGCGCGE